MSYVSAKIRSEPGCLLFLRVSFCVYWLVCCLTNGNVANLRPHNGDE